MTTHSGNFYLSLSQMQDNAVYLYSFFLSRGWTPNAIAAMLGNMQSESTINPGIWESLDFGNLSRGYGLVQWTPATKYLDWLPTLGLSDNFDSQMLRIIYELDNNLQWLPSLAGGMTFYEFSQSTASPYDLAILFITAYERPLNPNQPNRGTQANYWYEYLTGIVPPDPPDPPIGNNRFIELVLCDAFPLFR